MVGGRAMRILFMLAVFCSSIAVAAKTGNELLEECASGDSNKLVVEMSYTLCAAYIEGVRDMHDLVTYFDLGKNMREDGPGVDGMFWAMICAPDDSSQAQAIDIIVASLRADPVNRHEGAHMYVIGALAKAWPCDLTKLSRK